MGVLSNELSTWRKNIVECKKGEVKTLDFKDTRPNVMLVMNPSENQILCSVDRIPTLSNYDFNIKNHYARLVGKPTPTSQVYFLNNGTIDCTLQVYSIYDKNFDPSWLSDFSIDSVNIGDEAISSITEAIAKNAGLKKSELNFSSNNELKVQDLTQGSNMAKLLNINHQTNVINLSDILSPLNVIRATLSNDAEASGVKPFNVLLANESHENTGTGFVGLYDLKELLVTINNSLLSLIQISSDIKVATNDCKNLLSDIKGDKTSTT